MSPVPPDPERRALADRITEDVMQLLFTAHQDLQELEQDPTSSVGLLRSARESVLGAITVLRTIAETILAAAWGPPPDGSTGTTAPFPGAAAFDPLREAWVLICEDDDVLYVSPIACSLLRRDAAGVKRLFLGTGGPFRGALRGAEDTTGVRTTVAALDDREVRLESHPLTTAPRLKPAYLYRVEAA